MKTFVYLSTCDTCRRIIKETGISKEVFEFYDLKNNPISKEILDYILKQEYPISDLINRRSRKYQSEGWGKVNFSNEQWYRMLLEEYTLIKRPILIDRNHIFIGNTKVVVEAIKNHLG